MSQCLCSRSLADQLKFQLRLAAHAVLQEVMAVAFSQAAARNPDLVSVVFRRVPAAPLLHGVPQEAISAISVAQVAMVSAV